MSFAIEVVQGDITKCDVQAIVNAANNKFWMGAGVAGAIKDAGGEAIEEEAMSHGQKMPGEAIYTGAGRLPFKCVIHGAVMGQDLRTSDKLIRTTTISCLNIAEKLKLESVAFPAFGTGVGGFPIKACANLMITTTLGYRTHSHYLKRVIFCLYDKTAFQAFSEVKKNLKA